MACNRSRDAGPHFISAALALKPESVDRFLKTRAYWRDYGIRGREPMKDRDAMLPRYTGAGETAIHRAMYAVKRLRNRGELEEAIALLTELERDLADARDRQTIVPLMTKWNARYPAPLEVDLMQDDVPAMLDYVRSLRDSIQSRDVDPAWDAPERWWSALTTAFHHSGYPDFFDWLLDEIDSIDIETVFETHLAKPLRPLVGGSAVLHLTVRGITTVLRIIVSLEDQYPPLKPAEWRLLIDGRDFGLLDDLVLPGQRLDIVEPNVPPSGSLHPSSSAPSNPSPTPAQNRFFRSLRATLQSARRAISAMRAISAVQMPARISAAA
jgi:hypothetical protein